MGMEKWESVYGIILYFMHKPFENFIFMFLVVKVVQETLFISNEK
jgi:hypothetical protein